MKEMLFLVGLTLLLVVCGTFLLGAAFGSYLVGFIATASCVAYNLYETIQEGRQREKRFNRYRV